MRSELFRIPIVDLPINGYGVMVLLGVLAALWVLGRGAERRGIDRQVAYDIAIWMVLCGLAGGRIFYYIQFYRQFENDPIVGFFRIWEGGLVLYGAIIGGFLSLVFLLRRKNIRLLDYLDIAGPAVAVGVGFGRLGCLLHGCCWGKVCYPDFPLAMVFPPGSPPALDPITGSPGGAGPSLPVQPAQIYASVNAFLIAWVLWALGSRNPKPGTVIGMGAVLYGVSRFLLETVRGDHHPAPGAWPVSQILSVLVVVTGLVVLVAAHFRNSRRAAEVREGAPA